MRYLSYKDPSETLPIPADFSLMLVGGEIVSGGGCTISVAHGVDPTPSAVLDGGTLTAGSVVTQEVTGGVDGVDYVLHFTANTDDGHTYAQNLMLRVRSNEV